MYLHEKQLYRNKTILHTYRLEDKMTPGYGVWKLNQKNNLNPSKNRAS